MKIHGLLFLLLMTAFGCSPTAKDSKASQAAKLVSSASVPVKLDDYWYQGKAELNRYELQQNRYRDVHPGEAVLIFVTEDFLTDKQVKNDNYKNPNSINVLKTNFIRRFKTGIYDYSMMTSVFTPVDGAAFPQTLKVTTSVQDWCGHVFMQLNWRDNQYKTQVRSYFENEADEDVKVPYAILEDEVFNRIRINPSSLPIGKVKMLPSLATTRLLHTEFAPEDVQLSLKTYTGSDFKGEQLQSYRIEFATKKRVVEIIFENKSPYLIAGWKESYPSFDGKVRETIAKRTNTVVTAYWQQNGLNDTALRKELGVSGL